jgi:hypothetical protein
LKWVAQLDKCTDSWRSTVANGRVLVQEDLEDIPSLARELPGLLTWVYPRARRDAAKDTGPPDGVPRPLPVAAGAGAAGGLLAGGRPMKTLTTLALLLALAG